MIPDNLSSYFILHGHALKFKEEMPTSLTDILGEIVSIINFIKSVSRKTFVQLFELQAELAIFFFSSWNNIFQTMDIHTWVSGIHSKMNELSLSLQGKQLSEFVAVVKLELSSSISIWENLCL